MSRRLSSYSSPSIEIRSTLKGKLPSLPFLRMKEKVLGSKYELSLVFVGKKRMRTLNRIYRSKDYTTDILSFPNTPDSGEIFICPEKVAVKAKLFSRPTSDHLAFLFIHGLLHLKGRNHGTIMEQEEKTIGTLFGIKNL